MKGYTSVLGRMRLTPGAELKKKKKQLIAQCRLFMQSQTNRKQSMHGGEPRFVLAGGSVTRHSSVHIDMNVCAWSHAARLAILCIL